MHISRLLPAPKCGMMAALTIGRKNRGRMIRIGCSRKIALVARGAISRSTREFVAAAFLVTGLAVSHSMNARKGKSPIGVLLENIDLRIPVTSNMTILTVDP